MQKISAFHNGCLRRICRIFWPERISNEDLYKNTNCRNVVLEIKQRKLQWLGHVLRMDQNCIPKVALRWTPPGKRKQGEAKNNLAENCDLGTENGKPNLGRGTTCCTG
ncbi:hypothetical protein AAFF_G00277810 [Aldrovandia affinis]|uniref:Uncharacterized protein n=1 Tax=Aldrovandia affinis TaxID=143900 RepID=A0AAD7RAF8_9TELE|nr:hypothetical protein AAFF_G00277810 [Aldrovandia affinis]